MRSGHTLRPITPERDYIRILLDYFNSQSPDICKTLPDYNTIVYRAMPEKYVDSIDNSFITATTNINIAYQYLSILNRLNKSVIIAIYVPPNTPIFYIGGKDKEVLLAPGSFTKKADADFKYSFNNNNDELKFTLNIEDIYEGCDYNNVLKENCKKSLTRSKKTYISHNTPVSKINSSIVTGELLNIQKYNYIRNELTGGQFKNNSYTKKYLYEIATILKIKNRSNMDKIQLHKAIYIFNCC